MSFWRTFGFHTVSAIETILDGQDFTLEQLLDEDEILQETKSQNKKLLDFLSEHETLRKLIDYITKESPDETDQAKKYKFPFLACEILASEVYTICDALCQHDDLLQSLFGFLQHDPPLNSLLTSYTCRVIAILLAKKPTEILAFMQDKTAIISNFIKHLGNGSVMDLLLKIITNDENIGGQGTLEWLCKTDLIPSLVNKFDPKLSEDVHENASQALCDIIAVSSNNLNSPIIAQLESEEVIKTLFSYMLSEGANSSLVHGLSVVIQLLRRHTRPVYDRTTTVEELPTFLKLILDHLPKLHEPIDSSIASKESSKITFTFGAIVPLGLPKLRTVEFFATLFRTNLKVVEDRLVQIHALNSCLDLFFKYEWNNFLHQVVEQIIQNIIEGENDDLKLYMLKECRLPERICEANKLNDEDLTKPKGMRRGYMGYLTIIATNLNNLGANMPQVDSLLKENPAWQEYVVGPLASIQDKELSQPTDVSDQTPVYDEEDSEEYEESHLYPADNADQEEEEDPETLFERRVTEEEEEWPEKQIKDETEENDVITEKVKEINV